MHVPSIAPQTHTQSLTNLSLFLHFRSGARHHLQDQYIYTERKWTQPSSHTHCHHR